MLRPNVKCEISRQSGFDAKGYPVYTSPVASKCSVVKMVVTSVKTSVRADSSASRGRAQEDVSDYILLFPANVEIDIGDRVNVMGRTLRAESVQTRFTITGRIDHYEVGLNEWE